MRPTVCTINESEWRCQPYDLAMFALGFESRATCFLADVSESSKHARAFGFNHGHNKIYEQNRQRFYDAKVSVHDSLSDIDFESEITTALSELDDTEQQQIFADISCFTRFRLAAIVHSVFKIAKSRTNDLTVDFVYALAKFEKPNSIKRPNTVVGPAHQAFAGWSQGSYSSTATVLGLGYEQDQAMGVVEYLQAGEVWAFSPNSPIAAYKPEVGKANKLLLSEIPAHHVIQYDVCTPSSVVATLESVVRGLGDRHSVVLVPFGPKIFVLCTLIVAAIRQDVAVWRVSQGNAIEPHDRVASDVKVGLRLVFRGNKESVSDPAGT